MIAPRDARLGMQNMICRWISTGRLSMHLTVEPRPSRSDPCLCIASESIDILMDERPKGEFVEELRLLMSCLSGGEPPLYHR